MMLYVFLAYHTYFPSCIRFLMQIPHHPNHFIIVHSFLFIELNIDIILFYGYFTFRHDSPCSHILIKYIDMTFKANN